jgi:hypothetical protein
MINNLDEVFLNLRSHLKSSGVAIFVEPNKLFMNRIRRWWYRRDRFFDESGEEAIDHDELITRFSHVLNRNPSITSEGSVSLSFFNQ